MFNLFKNFFDYNQREINRLRKKVEEINLLEDKTRNLKDGDFIKETEKLKEIIRSDENKIVEILPWAFALTREAARRSLGQRHFDVQLMAAIALHEGKIVEQKTGEGKTLSSVPALYLNALSGKGVHLVTVNDYLARRDCGWMGTIFNFLGLTTAAIISDRSFLYDPKHIDKETMDWRLRHLKPVSRKEAYLADITYGINSEFGFDYLRDNMAQNPIDTVQRKYHYAIIDEADSVLIDEARTPHIISAPNQDDTSKYYLYPKIVNQLNEKKDFVVDEKLRTANLTDSGIKTIESILNVSNIYEKDFETLFHIEAALKAKTLFKLDKDYIVKDNEVIIVDEFTGRLLQGRRFSEGLHQAIEAKENVTIQRESKTLATVSLQNYFRMYKKLAGMTGTATTEAEEFHKIYGVEVIAVPTHLHMQRKDQSDMIYKTEKGKFGAAVEEIAKNYKNGRPILVGTTSIEKNEHLSTLLKNKGIPHQLLNAKNHEKEAEIISKAGEKGAVTVATNMAGRGGDIKLGKYGADLGGLYAVGTERHESRRIDNQLRGRSGRQGDSGETRFFISLEDDLMRIFGGEQVSKVMNFLKMPEDTPIEHGMVSKAIEGAQRKVEGHNFDIRKHTVEYDDVMNQQRQIIYGIRHKVLVTADNQGLDLKEEILDKIAITISGMVSSFSEEQDYLKLVEEYMTIVPLDQNSKKDLEQRLREFQETEKLTEFLVNLTADFYNERENNVGSETARQMEVFVYLNTIDQLWIEHLDTIDDLRSGIGLRGYAGRDPLVEYKKEAFDLFEKLVAEIDSEIVHRIFKVATQNQAPVPVVVGPSVEIRPEVNVSLEQETSDPRPNVIAKEEIAKVGETKVTIERGGKVIGQETYGSSGELTKQHGKIGRNDPCYCGSGKKYKKCHYPN